MKKKRIRFIGDYYSGYDPVTKKDVLITKKKVITVSEEKAEQLLKDFPEEFKLLGWRPEPEPEKEKKVELKKVEEVEEKKLEPLKDKKLEELKNK